MRERYDVVIIGAGPAGLTAGIYAARGGLDVVILEKDYPGGQAFATDLIENYPGFPDGTSGYALTESMRVQAEKCGAEIETAEVVRLEKDAAGSHKIVRTAAGRRVLALAVIIATGAQYRRLGIPGEEEFFGRGVSTCATCDAPLYRDKRAVVVGGGDTAVQGSLFLAKFVDTLTLVHRRHRLRATNILQNRIFELQPKIEFRWNSVATEVLGKDQVSGVSVKNVQTGEIETVPCDGVFILVGLTPNSQFVRGYVETDESGHIITDENMATSVEGVFACGDVRKNELKQVVAACGEAAVAAFSAQHYVDKRRKRGVENEKRRVLDARQRPFWAARVRQRLEDYLEREALGRRMSQIKHKILILSGRGGVGKSTVAANLAISLALAGHHVGLLDVDIHGASIPKLLNIEGRPASMREGTVIPIEVSENLKVMSIGLLLQTNEDPVVRRGPMKMVPIKQFLKGVEWGELDYLIIDSPPGTGNETLSLCQLVRDADGAVIVTTPQDVALVEVRKSVIFCRELSLPVFGIVENMSGFVCPNCGEVTHIFKTGGGEKLAREMGVPFLGRIPIDPQIVGASDGGRPYLYLYSDTETAEALARITRPVLEMTKPIAH